MLRGELREVVGEERAERAERKGALDEAIDGRRPKTVAGVLNESRELIAITLFVALVVGALIALVTGAWWAIFIALALHAIGTFAVVATTLAMASREESPDPRTAAALEARGVRDPEAALDSALRSVREDDGGT